MKIPKRVRGEAAELLSAYAYWFATNGFENAFMVKQSLACSDEAMQLVTDLGNWMAPKWDPNPSLTAVVYGEAHALLMCGWKPAGRP